MVGQSFPDRIITNDGDTIDCCITLANDQYVFFYYMKRDIRRPNSFWASVRVRWRNWWRCNRKVKHASGWSAGGCNWHVGRNGRF